MLSRTSNRTRAVAVFLIAFALQVSRLFAGSAVVDGWVHEGVAVTIDLPVGQHVRNIGAPKDGLGLCVFASMDMAARWHNIPGLIDIIHKIETGAGWPEKVTQVIAKYSPDTPYIQYEGSDPGILDRAMKRDSPACVTYGYSERYTNGGRMVSIQHMVLLVHLDRKWACILDNNYPGTFEWMSREEFLKRWTHPNGQGWAYVFLAPMPPPVPSN